MITIKEMQLELEKLINAGFGDKVLYLSDSEGNCKPVIFMRFFDYDHVTNEIHKSVIPTGDFPHLAASMLVQSDKSLRYVDQDTLRTEDDLPSAFISKTPREVALAPPKRRLRTTPMGAIDPTHLADELVKKFKEGQHTLDPELTQEDMDEPSTKNIKSPMDSDN